MSLPDLNEQVQRAIINICVREAPREAVGLLLASGQVVALPNHAAEPSRSFRIVQQDIFDSLREAGIRPEAAEPNTITLWHSHPSGGVGPSRTDLKNRVPHLHHLVVTLTEDEPVFSWY